MTRACRDCKFAKLPSYDVADAYLPRVYCTQDGGERERDPAKVCDVWEPWVAAPQMIDRKRLHELIRHRCGWLGRAEGDCVTNWSDHTKGHLCVNRVSCNEKMCSAVAQILSEAVKEATDETP